MNPPILEAEAVEEAEGQIILPAAVKREQEELDKVGAAVSDAVRRASMVEVRTPEEANAAAGILRNLKEQTKNAEATRKFLVGPLNAHVKRINSKAKEATAPLDAAVNVLKDKIETYQAELERQRREEEERLRREAAEREAKMKAERERAEAEARAKREEAERVQREAEDKARLAAERDAESQAAKEAARLAEEAAQQADQSKLEEMTLDALPDLPAPVPVVAEAPKVEGVQTRKVWKATVTQEALLPREYMVVDQKKINQAVRDGVREIPGVVIQQVSQVAVR
jgi:chromosome segregation ATPase